MSSLKLVSDRRQALVAALIVFIGAILFSTKAVLIKLCYREPGVEATGLLFWRMVMAAPFYILIWLWIERKKPEGRAKPSDWPGLIVLGLLGYYLSSYLDFKGLEYVTAGMERVILFVYPTMVVLISAVVLKRKVHKVQWVALAISYLGVGLAFGEAVGQGQGKNPWLGGALVFTSGFTYACYLIGSGQWLPRLGTWRFTSIAMLISSTAVICHQLIQHGGAPIYSHHVMTLALLMAIFSTVVPSLLISEGIRILGSSNAAIIGGVGPISTIVLATLFLGEPFTELQVIGTVLVIFGVTLIALRAQAQKTAVNRP